MKTVVTRQGIEDAIALAVRRSSPHCEAFVSVYLQAARKRGPSSWSLKGIKYGTASRAECDKALDLIVKVLQDEFDVAEEAPPADVRTIIPAVKIFG